MGRANDLTRLSTSEGKKEDISDRSTIVKEITVSGVAKEEEK